MRSEATALLPSLFVGCLLCPWRSEGASVPPGPCSLPRGYRRFHANDTFIGNPVTCNRDDKICFRYNLIFDSTHQRCEAVGGLCSQHLNRTEFEHGSGRLVGECKKFTDPCPGYRMAFDYRCYKKEVVEDVICARCAHITRHLLGGVECRDTPETPISVQQPKEDGRCLIPDLRYPDIERSKFFKIPATAIHSIESSRTSLSYPHKPKFPCEANQADCFAKGKVWVPEFEGCHTILEAGPCSAEHVVALDSRAAQQGRAEGTCVHVRGGCPRGHTRMLFDGQCHDDRELKVGAPGYVRSDEYGQYMIIPYGFHVGYVPGIVSPGICEIHFYAAASGKPDVAFPKPHCGNDNSGNCRLYEVENKAPKPQGD